MSASSCSALRVEAETKSGNTNTPVLSNSCLKLPFLSVKKSLSYLSPSTLKKSLSIFCLFILFFIISGALQEFNFILQGAHACNKEQSDLQFFLKTRVYEGSISAPSREYTNLSPTMTRLRCMSSRPSSAP